MKEINNTKRIIISSFKELMKEKSFDKISISDITDKSFLNRQTFYYHFQDKYELMNYIYYYEIFSPLTDELNEENYLEKFEQMLFKMQKEKELYINALSMNADVGFKEYLFQVLESLFSSLFPNKKSLDIKFYTFGFTGIISYWAKNQMKESVYEISHLFSDILNKA